jgi:AraC-like DNA-binding protein
MQLLAAGRPVTAVALEVGYDSPSAFIAMFKRTLGTTPHRYFATVAEPARTPLPTSGMFSGSRQTP